MLPLKKIVCPTDFSEPSFEALKAAEELALNFNSELILMHVVTSLPVVPSPGYHPTFNVVTYLQEMRDSAQQSLKEIMENKLSRELNVRPLVFQGRPADDIVKLAEDEKADLIVIATHGRQGWERFMFGSVAERVVRMARCPVLTIRGESEQ